MEVPKNNNNNTIVIIVPAFEKQKKADAELIKSFHESNLRLIERVKERSL